MGITPPNQPTEPTTPPSAGQTPPAEGATPPPTNGQGETPPDGTIPQNWDEYLEAQPENIQTFITDHISGLKSALDSERQRGRDLERQLRELSPQLEEGSQARQQVDQIAANLEQANSRADFYEDAAQAGVSNFRLAWLAVQDNPDEYTRRGRVQFDILRERNPELFRSTTPATPPGYAGAGTQNPPRREDTFDDVLRRGVFGA